MGIYIHSLSKEGKNNQVIYTFEEIVIEKNCAASQMPISIPAKVVIYIHLIHFLLIKLFIFYFQKAELNNDDAEYWQSFANNLSHGKYIIYSLMRITINQFTIL